MIQWTANQIQNNGNFYISWTVKDSQKQMGINGTTELSEEYTGDNLVDFLKETLGNKLVESFEDDATNISDSLPG
jgi:hypothetical protein